MWESVLFPTVLPKSLLFSFYIFVSLTGETSNFVLTILILYSPWQFNMFLFVFFFHLIIWSGFPSQYIYLILKCGSSVGLKWNFFFFLPERVYSGFESPVDLGALWVPPAVNSGFSVGF